VLISLNAPLLENVRNSSPMYVGTSYLHHPLTQGTTCSDFHLRAFGFYLSDFYFIKYLDYNLFHIHRPYMEGVISNIAPIYLRKVKEPRKDSLTEPRLSDFYGNRSEVVDDTRLDKGDIALLKAVKKILARHQTRIILLFPPNQQIKKMNPQVVAKVKEIFGQDDVFDFTGKNPFIHEEGDFLDDVHFKPIVARRILNHIHASGKEL
jgi:hypothetical protein